MKKQKHRNLRIYTVADSYFPNIGGMELVAKNSAAALAKYADSVLFAPKMRNAKDQLEPFKVFRVTSVTIRHPDLVLSLPQIDRKLKQYIAENPPDIIHIHNLASLSSWFLKYGKKHHIPVVLTTHGFVDTDIIVITKNKYIQKVARKKLLKPVFAADYVWAVSDRCAAYYKGLGRDDIAVIRNATEQTKPESLAPLKLGYQLNKDDLVLCYVNHMNYIKNIDLMVKAFQKVILAYPNAKLLMVGTGPDIQAIKQQVQDLKIGQNVIFTGLLSSRSQIAAIYKLSHLNLFPSVIDTAGLSPIESASQATPTLAMKIGSASEIIVDGQNGFLSENNIEDYAEQILNCLKDQNNLKLIGQNAKQTLHYTWNEYAKQGIKLYRSYLKGYKKFKQKV